MKKILAAWAIGCSITFPVTAVANDGMVTVPSKYSVAETIDRLDATIRAAQPPVSVFARVDLQAAAASQGGKVRPSQILMFGRGGVPAALLPQYPRLAMDLPLKALAWEDEQGKVWLTYNTGEFLGQRHGVAGREDLFKRVTDFTADLARKATE